MNKFFGFLIASFVLATTYNSFVNLPIVRYPLLDFGVKRTTVLAPVLRPDTMRNDYYDLEGNPINEYGSVRPVPPGAPIERATIKAAIDGHYPLSANGLIVLPRK